MNDDDLDDDYGRDLPRWLGWLIAFVAAGIMWGLIILIVREVFK